MKSEMRHIEHQGSFERKRHPAEMLTGLLAEQARRDLRSGKMDTGSPEV
jgi:hypothetical protein